MATIKGALAPATHSRSVLVIVLIIGAAHAAGCVAALGPGYTIDSQEIRVQFIADPQPVVRLDAEYRLRNTGNRPLTALELRLPGRRRFHFTDPRAQWDGHPLNLGPAPNIPRNVAITFPEPWTISASHTLLLSVEYQPAAPGEAYLSFSPDAFFLPAEGWSPQLIPPHGIFATGGIPPKKWPLTTRVPDGFLIHMSGRQLKLAHSREGQTVHAEQRPKDGYPFVIAGRYTATQLKAGHETINLWTRTPPQNSADLHSPADALIRTVQTYNTMFGDRSNDTHQFWIVECPVVAGCFSSSASNYAQLIYEDTAKPSAEMASFDSMVADLTGGPPEIAAAAAPSLASSWLGYGRNPGFYEQQPPLSALPAFAAARGREAVHGPQVRIDTIRRALRSIPVRSDPRKPEDEAVIRAKSLLFFFALQDRYGQDTCNKALSHMLYARTGGGFNLADLIAAFEQETHQNVAEFVRQWIKHPGVSADFRARYENAAAASAVATDPEAFSKKETMP
jgi:hypothetical protein